MPCPVPPSPVPEEWLDWELRLVFCQIFCEDTESERWGCRVWEVFRKELAFRIGVIAHESITLCFGRGGFLSAEAPIALLTVICYHQCFTRVWLWLVGEVWVL